jgi:hypothetical protein
MRRLFFVFSIFSALNVHAQVASVGIKDDLNSISKLGRLQGAEGLQNYSTGNVKGSRYFFPRWSVGKLVSSTGFVFSDSYVFLFDKINQDIYVRGKDSSDIYLVNKPQIENFELGEHAFLPGSKINGADPNNFYELIAGNNENFTLYKLIRTKFVKFDNSDLEKIKMGDFEDEFKDEISYYVASKDSPVKKITLSEKKLVQAFPEQKQKINEYYNQHQADISPDQFAAGLIDYLNK